MRAPSTPMISRQPLRAIFSTTEPARLLSRRGYDSAVAIASCRSVRRRPRVAALRLPNRRSARPSMPAPALSSSGRPSGGSAPAPGGGPGRPRCSRTGASSSSPKLWMKVSSSSYRRTVAGLSPRCITRRIASTPWLTLSTSNPRKTRSAGAGASRRRAEVTMPSVPSLPRISWVQLGPRVVRASPSVCTISPRPVTTVSPATRSSTLPYLVEHLAGGAGGQPSAHGRAVDRRREVAEGVTAALELALEPLAVVAGLDVADHLVGVDADQLVHPLEVDGDAATQRDHAAADAGAAAVGDHRHAQGAGQADDLRHFAGRLGPDHRAGQVLGGGAVAHRQEQPRPHVAGIGVPVGLLDRHAPGPDQASQLAVQCVRIEGRARHARGMVHLGP